MIKSLLINFRGYAVRPQLYPELGRKIYKNIFERDNVFLGKDIARQWCVERAIPMEKALIQLTGKNFSFEETYPLLMSEATEIQENCPVEMEGRGALDLIYGLCEFTKATKVIETGVAYGWSSLAALQSLQKRGGTLYSSDMPYVSRNNDQFVGCVVPPKLRQSWKLFRQADREALPKIFKEEDRFQLVHYDSDKSYNGRLWAYDVLWNKLETNGYFISHEIAENAGFMDWVKKNNLIPIIIELEGKYIGVIKKNALSTHKG